eukprot:NODE_161_length_16629_cov_0.427344.p3 type:complete len:438 gc:universal NODE_161_length_16629_cov_0.427344:16550-15237(-)
MSPILTLTSYFYSSYLHASFMRTFREFSVLEVVESHNKATLKKARDALSEYLSNLPVKSYRPTARDELEKDPETLGKLETTTITHPKDYKSERIWLKYTTTDTEVLLGGEFIKPKPSNQIPITTFWSTIEPYFRHLNEEDHMMLRQISNDPAPYAPPLTEYIDPIQHRIIQIILMDESILKAINSSDALEFKQINSSLKSENEDLKDRLFQQLAHLGFHVYDKSPCDELAMAIKHIQRHLKLQELINHFRKQILAQRVKFIISFHQYTQLLNDLDKEIEVCFNKKIKNRKKRRDDDDMAQFEETNIEIKALLDKRDSLLEQPGSKFDEFTKDVVKPAAPKITNNRDYAFLVNATLHFHKFYADSIPSESVFKSGSEELKSQVLEHMYNWCVPVDADMDLNDKDIVDTIFKFWNEKPFPTGHYGLEYLRRLSQNVFDV